MKIILYFYVSPISRTTRRYRIPYRFLDIDECPKCDLSMPLSTSSYIILYFVRIVNHKVQILRQNDNYIHINALKCAKPIYYNMYTHRIYILYFVVWRAFYSVIFHKKYLWVVIMTCVYVCVRVYTCVYVCYNKAGRFAGLKRSLALCRTSAADGEQPTNTRRRGHKNRRLWSLTSAVLCQALT